MKRTLTLLAVAMVTAAASGCNCCPCLRNICPVGLCSNLCAPAAPAPYCPPPAPVCAPACPPAPVYAAPQQYTVPQYASQQYVAAPAPAVPVFNEAACGTPCAACPPPCQTCPAPCTTCAPMMTEVGCGMPMTAGYDMGCGYGGGYMDPAMGMSSGMQSQPMMMDPGPAPGP
jgi:hypothetical protein